MIDRLFTYSAAEPADKPGFVALSYPKVTVIPLGPALLLGSCNLPVDSAGHLNVYCLVLLRMGFTLPSVLPRPRCALTDKPCGLHP